MIFRYNILLLLILFSVVGFAQSNGFTIPQQTIQWRNIKGDFYSPFDRSGYYHKTMLSINIPTNASGDYFIGVESDGTDVKRSLSHSSNQTLVYFLTSNANTNQYLLDWPMITSKENTISFSLSGNNQPIKKVPLYVWIDPGQDVSPHTFTGELRVNIYKGTVSQGTFDKVGTGKITLLVKISEDIQVSLGNDQFSRLSEFKVKFEELKKGQVIVYDAYVNSFDSYMLKVKSEGKGHLTHHLDQVKTKIPYEISIDNQKVLFDEFGQSSQAVEKSGKAEKSHHKIKLILGETRHAFKGEYSDKLSIQASPKN